VIIDAIIVIKLLINLIL